MQQHEGTCTTRSKATSGVAAANAASATSSDRDRSASRTSSSPPDWPRAAAPLPPPLGPQFRAVITSLARTSTSVRPRRPTKPCVAPVALRRRPGTAPARPRAPSTAASTTRGTSAPLVIVCGGGGGVRVRATASCCTKSPAMSIRATWRACNSRTMSSSDSPAARIRRISSSKASARRSRQSASAAWSCAARMRSRMRRFASSCCRSAKSTTPAATAGGPDATNSALIAAALNFRTSANSACRRARSCASSRNGSNGTLLLPPLLLLDARETWRDEGSWRKEMGSAWRTREQERRRKWRATAVPIPKL